MPVAGLKSTNNTPSGQYCALKVFEEICLLAPIVTLVLSCKFHIMEMLIYENLINELLQQPTFLQEFKLHLLSNNSNIFLSKVKSAVCC